MMEVQAGAIPEGWLDGRYLSNAAEYEDVRDAWSAYHAFVRELRTRERRLHGVAYLGALNAEGVGGALRSLCLARARSDFAAGRAHREEVYGRIEELSLAALSLHALLAQHTGSIRYEPAVGSRLSAAPVLEAAGIDSESQLLLERALDRVLTAAGLGRTRCDGDGEDFGLGDRIDRPGSGGDRRHALSSGAPRPPRPARAPLDWMLPPADVGTVTGLPRSGRNASRGIAFWPVEVRPPVS